MKKNEINITVTLDDNNVPEKIEWVASNVGAQNTSQAMLLSMWDNEAKNMVRIDMWTKDMMMDEMKQFFHQSFLSMANTLERHWRGRCRQGHARFRQGVRRKDEDGAEKSVYLV